MPLVRYWWRLPSHQGQRWGSRWHQPVIETNRLLSSTGLSLAAWWTGVYTQSHTRCMCLHVQLYLETVFSNVITPSKLHVCYGFIFILVYTESSGLFQVLWGKYNLRWTKAHDVLHCVLKLIQNEDAACETLSPTRDSVAYRITCRRKDVSCVTLSVSLMVVADWEAMQSS